MAALKSVPGLRRRSGYINVLMRQLNPAEFYLKLARRYGDIVYYKFGPLDSILINHPDYIRDVLVTGNKRYGRPVGAKILSRMLLGQGLLTSEGEFHLRQRRLIQPAFHRGRIAGYANQMVELSERMAEHWRELPQGQPVDIAQEMMRLTLSIVSRALFNADVERDAPEVGAAMEELFVSFDRSISPIHTVLSRLGMGGSSRFAEARATLDRIIYRIIDERRALKDDQGDLLSMLLMAQDEDGSGGMSNQQVRDETMTLFLAGHETTALALTWCWYLLAQHPQVEAHLHAELDEVLNGRAPSFEDVPRLRYTEQVFAETLRLYPPAWLFGRASLVDHEIGGYRIPAGTTVIISPYVTHRDARHWPDPLRFDPDRWTPEASEARPKFAYVPFGGGPRLCIGEQFAWMEGMLAVATLARTWRLRLMPGQRVEPKPMITLRPKGGMKMLLERR